MIMRIKRILLGSWMLLLFSGCATFTEGFKPVEERISAGAYAEALKLVEAGGFSERDKVLFLFNKGMILRMAGDFSASNVAFEESKALIDQLSVMSVSEQAGSVSVNDSMRSYVGESYEQVLLHIYKALNFLELGKVEDARIEVLQADTTLLRFSASPFKDDGFARYLSGIVFEILNEADDALISYRHAYNAYKANMSKYAVPVPDYLRSDLLRLTKKLGFAEEFDQFSAEFVGTKWADAKSLLGKGEVIILVHNGLAPPKQENGMQTIVGGKAVRVAVPYYKARLDPVRQIRVGVDHVQADGVLVENIDAIARNTLEEDMPAIVARTVARLALKKTASDNAGGALGAVISIAGAIAERADTRSWLTLPNNIYMARISLDPGQYDIEVAFFDQQNKQIATRKLASVIVAKGGKVFRSTHWMARGAG